MKTENYEVVSSGEAILLLLSKIRLKEVKQFLIDSKRNVELVEMLEDIHSRIEIID